MTVHISPSVMLAQQPTAATLLADIRSGDLAVRQMAVEQAPLVGTPAIVPLGLVMASPEPAPAKAAVEALRRIVHNCARPKAPRERIAATRALLALAGSDRPTHVRAEALYLLGFVASADTAASLAAYLSDSSVREDARLALERIPGARVDAVLRRALTSAPADFGAAIQQTLDARRRPRTTGRP